ncbi:MAG: DUF2283 domain-containing protein [Candidatus Vogelbacteria bacterium]|nr:DUF2283 domain-containing protein [Candidatus Vogelbacteria bacterium]
MNINYDKTADAVYINLKKGKVAKTAKLAERLLVDLDKSGKILGLEILDASSQIAKNKMGRIEVGVPVFA